EARVSFQAPVSPEVTLARFSADGAFLAATDLTGTARIWDAASGNEIVSVRHAPPVRHLAFSTNNRFLITGGLDGIARVWRLPSGALTAELKHGPALTHAIDQVAFSSDGRNDALVVGIDNAAQIWSAQGWKNDARLERTTWHATPRLRHSDRVTGAFCSPD